MNRVFLIGNLTRDVEIRTLPSGSIVGSVGIATNKKYKNKAGETISEVAFHNLVLWNKGADIFAKYMRKGSKVYVEGEIKYDKYTGKDGVERTVAKIIVNNFEFLDSKPKQEGQNNQNYQPAQNQGGYSNNQNPVPTPTPTPNPEQNNNPENNQYVPDNNEEEIRIEDIPF